MPVPVLLMVQQLTQGGSERQLAEIAKSLDRRRFTPHVAVLRPGGIRYEELERAGLPVVPFPLASFGSPRLLTNAWAFGRYLRRHGIQLVHSFDVPGNIFAVPVARAFGIPVVLSSQRAFRTLASSWMHWALRFTDRLADGIVVNCKSLEHHLIADEGVPAGRIRLCYNGIDTELFCPGPAGRPAALAGASLVVGAVCALRPEKGLATLVRAFAEARSHHPGLRLLLVGDGPVRAELEQLQSALSLGEACVFAPSTSQVPAWLRCIDIFVMPSLSEAFSNSIMEAMACRCAVIASRTGGNPELVAHGERGLLFTPGDAPDLARSIRTLAASDTERQRLAEAGCRFIHHQFPIAVAASRMAAIYEEALQRKT